MNRDQERWRTRGGGGGGAGLSAGVRRQIYSVLSSSFGNSSSFQAESGKQLPRLSLISLTWLLVELFHPHGDVLSV